MRLLTPAVHVTDTFGIKWMCSPACTELENVTMDWMAKLYGLSPDFYNSTHVGGGVIQVSDPLNPLTYQRIDRLRRQTAASDGVLVAIVAARSRYQRLYPEVPAENLVVYVTTQTHSIGLKSGLVLGLPVHVIPVRSEDNYSLRGQDLREVIEMDKSEGKHPIFISKADSAGHVCQGLNFYSSRYRRNYLERCD